MTIRDESIKALAEALSRRFGWSEGVATRNAEAVLSDSTLARRLDFATAWDDAVEECKRLGWRFGGVGPYFLKGWAASAWPSDVHDSRIATGHGTDETAALVALAAALRERQP